MSTTTHAKKETAQTQSVLVLGVGNILLSDEGAGVKAVEMLREQFKLPPQIDAVDGGTIGIELLPYFEGRSSIIFIDAVKTGHRPGTVTKIDDIPAYFQHRTSPHQIGILDVLALSSLRDTPQPKTMMFGIEPKCLDTGIGISGEVQANMPYLVAKVVDELLALGFDLHAKTP